MKKSALRWLPAVGVPVVVIAAAITVPAFAETSPTLPDKSASEVLQLVADSDVTAYSGTLEQRSDLGLPELPAMGGSDSSGDTVSSALELLTGSHTARVFVGGADTSRVQVMDTLAERDVVRNGSDVWLYSSDTNEATHVALDQNKESAGEALPQSTATPAEITSQLLDSLDPTTTVTVGDTAKVAGRSAYSLTLTPKTDNTLVGSVTVSVDSETGLPLGVIVTANGSKDPAFSVTFSSIDFATPDAALFTFTPPAGATVTEAAEPTANAPSTDSSTDGAGDHPRPIVTGEGWDAIVEFPAGDTPTVDGSTDDATESGSDATALLEQLTVEVPEGRVVQTSLVSILFTTDGRTFAGAVSAEQLQAAARAAE